jgi:HD-GYP domain-containing protein (c-di-GMP phosphodiesterase class II)
MKGGPGAFLRTMAAVVRAYGLYPAGHPILEEKIDELVAALEETRQTAASSDGAPLVYLIHEDSFFFDDKLLAKESIAYQWMMRLWQSKGVESLTIERWAVREDLFSFVDFLVAEGQAPSGALRMNFAKLVPPEEAQDAESIRNIYSDALDLTRQIGLGLDRGDDPTLGSTRNTVERLVDGVVGDPASAVLLSTMQSHDEATFFHMVNVCILSVATGAAIGLNREQLTVLGMGGLLHDIGKIGVPSHILNRSGKLTDEEWAFIRRHPSEGAGMLLRSWSRISPLAAKMAFEHHVRLDGTGYPSAPVSESPDLMSRIVAVVDTFDAMTSRRSYRRAEQRQRALDVLASGAGSHYDPRIVRVFIKVLGFYPPGSVVQLNDGAVAVVVRNNPKTLDRPVVKLVRTPTGEQLPDAPELDLESNSAMAIVAGLDQSEAGMDPADLIYPVSDGRSVNGSS